MFCNGNAAVRKEEQNNEILRFVQEIPEGSAARLFETEGEHVLRGDVRIDRAQLGIEHNDAGRERIEQVRRVEVRQNRRQTVFNSHGASQQIWLSANMAAWHFAWHEPTSSWRDTKTGAELFTELGLLVGQKLSQPLKLRS